MHHTACEAGMPARVAAILSCALGAKRGCLGKSNSSCMPATCFASKRRVEVAMARRLRVHTTRRYLRRVVVMLLIREKQLDHVRPVKSLLDERGSLWVV